MKVLINAASAHVGGAVTYINNVLSELPHVAGDDRFIVIVPPDTLGLLEKTVDQRIITLIPYPHRPDGVVRRLAFDSHTVPRLVREHGADVLFSSTGFGTLRAPCPQALLVRNPIYFCPTYEKKHKELGRSYHPIRLRRWMSLLSVRAADVVMFPTGAMQAMVEDHISLAQKQTEALHYGFARDRFFQDGSEKPGLIGKLEKWREEGYRVLLNVSVCTMHKNLETVIDALPRLIASGEKVKLVMTFARNSLGDPEIFDRLTLQTQKLGLSDTVVSSGHVKHDQLHHLYRNADLFVFPSFTESFGHPLVEAMACGLPIVASDMAVNREVCGRAASYFDTFDPNSCAESLLDILARGDHNMAMRRYSLERAKDFSWRSYAGSLIEILRKAEAGHHEDMQLSQRDPCAA